MVEINNELLDFCIKELEKIDKEWIKRNSFQHFRMLPKWCPDNSVIQLEQADFWIS